MKILKGIIGAIVFAAATFWLGFYIYLQTDKMFIAGATLIAMIGAARLGYSVGTGHINSFGLRKKK